MGGSRHSLLNKAVLLITDRDVNKMMSLDTANLLTSLVDEVDRNLLVHSIVKDAISIGSDGSILFLYEIPRNVVALHTAPLVMGYLRSKCDCFHSIPPEIGDLIVAFF